MTPRPGQPEPFIRGAAYPAFGDVPYPRANPTDTARLPADVWSAAMVPVGIRLELVGDAQAIDIAYRTTNGNLGYRGDGAGITFSVWRGGRKVCEEEASLGDGLIRLSLGTGAPDKPAIIYLPEGMHPVILSLTAVKGEIAPAPELPRWIAYGDWTTQGWTASGPSHGWAAIAARKANLDLVNLGYAGAGRGEIVSAEHISGLEAAVVTIAYGASCWTRVPHSVGMVTEGFRAFVDIVRQGHPRTPVVVFSPILRPDAEDVPNRLGATMADIRHAMETITRERILGGDTTLSLVAGEAVIGVDHLDDGIHPGDEGHKRIASAVTKALGAAMRSAGDDPPNGALIGNAILFGGQPGSTLHGFESPAGSDADDGRPNAAYAEDDTTMRERTGPADDGGADDAGSAGRIRSGDGVGSVGDAGSVDGTGGGSLSPEDEPASDIADSPQLGTEWVQSSVPAERFVSTGGATKDAAVAQDVDGGRDADSGRDTDGDREADTDAEDGQDGDMDRGDTDETDMDVAASSAH